MGEGKELCLEPGLICMGEGKEFCLEPGLICPLGVDGCCGMFIRSMVGELNSVADRTCVEGTLGADPRRAWSKVTEDDIRGSTLPVTTG